MNKNVVVVSVLVAVVVAFIAGAVVYRERTGAQAEHALKANSEALVRAHSPVYGNPAAQVTIVEFFDPACETCRAFYPIVKGIVNSSFGQVRLVTRYAPLHQGSDTAIMILEAARLQGKYWEAVERALAAQPQWASHDGARPELIWTLMADLGLDLAKARADVYSPEIERLLLQDVADMKALQVTKTPGFFVNGMPLVEFGEAPLRALVARELKNAKGP